MNSVLTGDYFHTLFLTICVVTVALFAPQVNERDMSATHSADDISKLHCHFFGWPMLLGGIGLLFSIILDWSMFASVIAGEILLFGVMYFIGLLAHQHDKEIFQRRCSAVCRRYQEALRAVFGERDENNQKKKPDLAFMKRVEAHADVEPDQVVSMRIRFARLMQTDATCHGEVEAMVQRYVRAGGTA